MRMFNVFCLSSGFVNWLEAISKGNKINIIANGSTRHDTHDAAALYSVFLLKLLLCGKNIRKIGG